MNPTPTLLSAVALSAALLSATGTAQAALMDRGGGLIYDDVLNVTWLADANYAKTSGYDTDGLMTWSQATTWAANLSYYDSVRGVTYTDWRLPTTGPVNGSTFNYSTSYNGSTDVGANVSEQGTAYAGSTGSEMAHLFYNSLNDKGYCNPTTSTVNICEGPQAGWGLVNTGPFTNFQSSYYWSGTEYAPDPSDAWFFNTGYGSQGYTNKDDGVFMFALAVRPGDVAAVPVPAAAWLLGSGLLGLIGVARRQC